MKRVREVRHAVNPAFTAEQSVKPKIQTVKKLKIKISTQNVTTTKPQKLLKPQKPSKPSKPLKSLKRTNTNSTSFTPKQINASDFKIQKCIGEGAFGKVYTVSTTLPTSSKSEIFAMKSVQKSKILSAAHHIKNHTREFEIMKQIRHPCIIGLKFAFQTRKTIKFVMEFGQGGDLFSLLSRHGSLSEHQAKFYIGQLALVLEYLHKNSIMYRDLKTENILLSKTGNVKLADFGLSRKLKSGDKAYSFSGTPEYMAPEMLNSRKRNVSGYGKYVDFWSLGVLFFQLLHNNTPFQENGLNGKEQVKDDNQNVQNSKTPKSGKQVATSSDNSDSGQSGHSTGSVNTTEFYEKPQDRLFKVIKQANAMPIFEKPVSDKVQNLICGLLNFSYRGRIKSANQIFNHAFFSDVICRHDYINGKIKPPIVPSVDNSEDVSCFDEEYIVRKISDSASMTHANDGRRDDGFEKIAGKIEVVKLAQIDSFAYTNVYGYPVTKKLQIFPDLSEFKALSGFTDLSTKDASTSDLSVPDSSVTDLSVSDFCSFNFSKNTVHKQVPSSFSSQLSNQSVESAYELNLEDGFFQEVKKIQKIAPVVNSDGYTQSNFKPLATADLSGWSFLDSSSQTTSAKEIDVFSCFHYDYTVGGVRCTYEL